MEVSMVVRRNGIQIVKVVRRNGIQMVQHIKNIYFEGCEKAPYT
jgi:hypothetical protein